MKNKIAINIFLPSLRGGGAQRVMVDIANGLAQRGYDITLITAYDGGVYNDMLNKSVKYTCLRKRKISSSFISLLLHLKKNKPSHLIITQRHANLLGLLVSKLSFSGSYVIARETNSYAYVFGRKISLKNRIVDFLVKYSYRFCDLVIAPSKGVMHDLYFLKNVITIPNPVCLPEQINKINNMPPFLLGVGSLDAQKRFDDLLYAYALVASKCNKPIPDLVILGEGNQRGKLLKIANELNIRDKLHLPGFVNNPFDYMKQAKVFVLSSGWEGLPNALLQAMYCGVPVVATDCPHGPREILADGQYGELVTVGDIEGLAHAIMITLDRDKKEYPEKALSPYMLDSVLDQYEKVIREVMT